jgi:hypothetical protein
MASGDEHLLTTFTLGTEGSLAECLSMVSPRSARRFQSRAADVHAPAYGTASSELRKCRRWWIATP